MPADHSPPMPKPNSARNPKSIVYDVEKPLRNAKSENHNTDNINGNFRPYLSASDPATAAPESRMISVTLASAPASAPPTVKLFWMSIRRKASMLKSKASTTHPRNTPQNARHCSRLTCAYQGIAEDSKFRASRDVSVRGSTRDHLSMRLSRDEYVGIE